MWLISAAGDGLCKTQRLQGERAPAPRNRRLLLCCLLPLKGDALAGGRKGVTKAGERGNGKWEYGGFTPASAAEPQPRAALLERQLGQQQRSQREERGQEAPGQLPRTDAVCYL